MRSKVADLRLLIVTGSGPREKWDSVPRSLQLFTVAHTLGSQRHAHYLCMKPWMFSPGVTSSDTFKATQESHSVS